MLNYFKTFISPLKPNYFCVFPSSSATLRQASYSRANINNTQGITTKWEEHFLMLLLPAQLRVYW